MTNGRTELEPFAVPGVNENLRNSVVNLRLLLDANPETASMDDQTAAQWTWETEGTGPWRDVNRTDYVAWLLRWNGLLAEIQAKAHEVPTNDTDEDAERSAAIVFLMATLSSEGLPMSDNDVRTGLAAATGPGRVVYAAAWAELRQVSRPAVRRYVDAYWTERPRAADVNTARRVPIEDLPQIGGSRR